jgi:hypothetical protein
MGKRFWEARGHYVWDYGQLRFDQLGYYVGDAVTGWISSNEHTPFEST